MSGKKQFDETEALASMTELFWRHGFEATAYEDLRQASGLNKSSLYNAYGNKQQLFERCLELYGQKYGGPVIGLLEQPDVHKAFTSVFEHLFKRYDTADVPNGCMAVVAATGNSGTPAQFAGARAIFQSLTNAFTKRLDRAVGEGDLAADTDTAALAQMLVALSSGFAVLNSAGSAGKELRPSMQRALSLLKSPPLKSGTISSSGP